MAAVLLFWAQTISVANDRQAGQLTIESLAQLASIWLLIIITVSIVLPWLRLKKVAVQIAKPSDHAVLVKFDHGVTPFAGSSTPVSR